MLVSVRSVWFDFIPSLSLSPNHSRLRRRTDLCRPSFTSAITLIHKEILLEIECYYRLTVDISMLLGFLSITRHFCNICEFWTV